MPNIENLKKYKNIHMIGIGGVSMSGIAAILTNWGFNVTGSDWAKSEATDKLNSMGIKVTIGHNLEDVAKSDVVVYSAAIKQDDPEMLEAKKLNIPTVGIVDTNCNPEVLDYAIPGNDDAIRAVKLITDVMANAVIEGKQGESFEESQDVASEEAETMEEVVAEVEE